MALRTEAGPRAAGKPGHLRLVAPPDDGRPRLAGASVQPRLGDAPFRPGELLTSLRLALNDAARERACDKAREHPLPPPLWVRVTIEAARAVARSAALIREVDTVEVAAALDEAATASPPAAVSELGRYAVAVRTGERAGEAIPERLELLIPQAMMESWKSTAAQDGASLDDWASRQVVNTPTGAPLWEAAAAGAGETLAEWIYSCCLRSFAERSAEPHLRTY